MSRFGSLVFLGFLTLIFLSGCINYAPRQFSSRHSYELQLVTNESLQNATFYIPLPVNGSSPSIGSKKVNSGFFEQQGCQAALLQNPDGLNHEGSYDVSGSKPWFLELKCGALQSGELYHIEISETSSLSPPLFFVNTRDPIGNESIILPKFNLTNPSNTSPAQSNPFHLMYPVKQATQHTLVYADYSSTNSTDVSIFFALKGYNQWLESYDAWQGNSYQEMFFWKHLGEFHGWMPVEGALYTGSGVYPNPSNPEWQKLLPASEK